MGFLNTALVDEVFNYCFLKKSEAGSLKEVVAGAFGFKGRFHPHRLEEKREVIQNLLAELPDDFRGKKGAPFKAAYVDKHGVQWAGNEPEEYVDLLLCLAIAIDAVADCDLPLRKSWLRYPTFFKLK